MEKIDIYINVEIVDYVSTYNYLYHKIHEDVRILEEIDKYVEQFNMMVDKYENENVYDFSGLLMRFKITFDDLNYDHIDINEFRRYFQQFLDNKELFIEPFLLGYNKRLVDDIFQMDLIRPYINYDMWTYNLYSFNNGLTTAEITAFATLLSSEASNNLADLIQTICDHIPTNLILKDTNNILDTYQPGHFVFERYESTAYDRPPTLIQRRFWDILLVEATDDELNQLLEINIYQIYILAKTEHDRRTNFSSTSVLNA